MRETYVPTDAGLKRYVKYIAFSRSNSDHKEFLVFPNPGCAIGLHHRHGFEKLGNNAFRTVDKPREDIELLHVNRIDPVKVVDMGERESITIVFTPLGVNYFLDDDLCSYVQTNQDASFIPLANCASMQGFSKQVFEGDSDVKRLSIIERFLLSRFKEKNLTMVTGAVEYLCDMERSLSIDEICRSIGTSSRNLTRLFHKHLCLTPVEFRNIYQFRFSLDTKIERTGEVTLKDIGYESNYHHASYMIRMYKKYTGLNPSAFFNKVSVEDKYVFMSL